MSDHVYKLVDIVGTSTVSVEDAIQIAIARASKTLRNLAWFKVIETRGQIVENEVAHYQVTLELGFTLDPEDH